MFRPLGVLWRRVRPAGLGRLGAAHSTVSGRRPRRVVVHAGLHKTGTTALQTFLASVADQLRRSGILYPNSGRDRRLGYGHHNVAWQITGDRRFRSSSGTIDDLANEVARFGGDVILSSEDFESVIDQPDCFAPLRNHPALRDHYFTILIYVRNQVSYAESLFLELINQGIGEEFMLFVKPLLRDRQFQVRQWRFHFDYARIFNRWSACGWANPVVRNYHELMGGSVVTDFCNIVCPDFALDGTTSALRANPRAHLHSSLLRFYSNRVQRPLEQREEKAIEQISSALEGMPITLSNGLRLVFNKTFATANQSLCFEAGLPETGLLDWDSACASAVPLERLFSSQLHDMVASSMLNLDLQAFTDMLWEKSAN